MVGYDEIYTVAHSWLVRHTQAYERLFASIAERVACGDYPRELPALLVPSSTGEILPRLASSASRWQCVDYAPSCLASCGRMLPGVLTHRADLDSDWPFAPAEFGLTVSVHALHFLSRPEFLIERMAGSVAPGGLGLWAVFQGDGARQESTRAVSRRLLRTSGAREAANFLPWKLLDQLMLVTSGRTHHFWTSGALTAMFERYGFEVESIEPTFNGCSWLVCTRRKETRRQ